jgi:glycosyltransferase involved in cell wall biosynthesis
MNQPGLLVFADDWGRHPSSCQHLVRLLLDRRPVSWVNTIGTRTPQLNLATLQRAFGKFRQWLRGPASREPLPANLHVLNPKMWPWFTRPMDRWLNRKLLVRQLASVIRAMPEPPVAITTLPIVADLMDELDVRRWIYYCVDDFSQWPGLDQATLRRMEEALVRRADVLVAVSETLRDRLARMGRESHLLTHGVDLDFWRTPATAPVPALDGLERPLIVFWGVVDRRMDVALVKRLAADMTHGTIILLGPKADPEPGLFESRRVVYLEPLPFEQLPVLAQAADVLVMPYEDLPVTRAMQPLKLKEYLATGKPAVVRDLPATHGWADCLDLAATPEAFSQAVRLRLSTGLPTQQKEARARLADETWAEKARQLEQWIDFPTDAPPKARPLASAHRRPARRNPVVLDARVVSGSGGGPDKTILNSPRFLEPAGYHNLCAYMHPPGDPGFVHLQAKARLWNAPLLSIPDRGPCDWRVVKALLRICRRERVRIWHGHDYKSNALGLLLRLFWPMRLVTTVHGWVKHTRRTPLYYAIDRFCLPRYEKVICVSPDLEQECLAAGVPAERCVLIENGIDIEEFSRRHSIDEAKRRQGIPPDRLCVGAVGRLSPEKGFDLLIKAVDGLLKEGLDLELVIIGDGDEQSRLQDLIGQLGRGDRIRLPGYRADLRELYEAMDVFALSSLREGLPNVLLEAMALETPVVATRIAGVPRLVADGVNGLLVEPGSVGALAEALSRLLADADLRWRLGQAGRETINARYSFATRMGRIGALYDELLDRKVVL